MIKHQIEISVSDPKGRKRKIISGGEFSIRSRLMNFLFGKEQRVLVLLPADSVESVSIKEVSADGTA